MPIVLFFSSRQISAHPFWNFCSNQSTPSDSTTDNIEKEDQYILPSFIIWLGSGYPTMIECLQKLSGFCFNHVLPQCTNIHERVNIWTASSEFGTYSLCKQRRFRRACTSAQSRQNLRCSLIQAVSQEEPSDRKPDPWPL